MKLSRQGLGVMVIAVALLVVGWTVPVPAVIPIAMLLFSLLTVNAIFVWIRSRGQHSEVTFRTSTAEIGDDIALPHHLVAEDSRWIRIDSMWLEARGPVDGRHHVAASRRGSSTRGVIHHLGAQRRGVVTIVAAGWRGCDPWGLWNITRMTPIGQEIFILPRREPHQVASVAGVLGSTESAATAGESIDDVMARQWQPGDALRRWHWKATAHRDTIMVRQSEQEGRRRVALWIDIHENDPAAFEWAVSAAATVVESAPLNGDLHRLHAGSHVIDLTSRSAKLQALCSLAALQPSSESIDASFDSESLVLAFVGSSDPSPWCQRRISPGSMAFVWGDNPHQEQLRAAGWKVATVGENTSLAQAIGVRR